MDGPVISFRYFDGWTRYSLFRYFDPMDPLFRPVISIDYFTTAVNWRLHNEAWGFNMDEIRSAGIRAAKKSWSLSRAAATRDLNESNIE